MRLLLLRHCEALSCEEAGVNHDADRPLSRRGAKAARGLARLLSRGRIPIDRIWTSPARRARETAQPIATRLALPLSEEPALGLDPDPQALLAACRRHPHETLLLVGHEPFLGVLSGALLCGDGSGVPFPLSKGALIALECLDGPARLLWLLGPELARACSRKKKR